MADLDVSLLGDFTVSWHCQPVPGFDASRVQDLFSYLLLFRNQPHLRETLATLLWPESSSNQSRKYLRQTLWQLHTALQPMSAAERPFLLTAAETIRLNPTLDLRFDVALLEATALAVRGVPGRLLDACQTERVEEAVALYRGELLAGRYHDWCLYERQRLQDVYLTLLDKLMARCETNGEFEAGVAYGQRILRYDRAREITYRSLMRLAYLAGDRTTALRYYESCAAALLEELDVRPSARTQRLAAEIRSDRLATALDPFPQADELLSLPRSAENAPIAVRLRSIWSTLSELERQLHAEIHDLEQVPDAVPHNVS